MLHLLFREFSNINQTVIDQNLDSIITLQILFLSKYIGKGKAFEVQL